MRIDISFSLVLICISILGCSSIEVVPPPDAAKIGDHTFQEDLGVSEETLPDTGQDIEDAHANEDVTSDGCAVSVEKCDGEDNDCDGETDEEGAEGCNIYYRDEDMDGFGGSEKRCLCEPDPPFTADKTGDCDDKNPRVFPEAIEVCANGLDDNCDGKTDESSCQNCTTFFRDDDEDGFGLSGDTKCLDAPQAPYTAARGGDCDDKNPKVNPGAIEECEEGIQVDNDCNGKASEENAQGCVDFYYDYDRDGWGTSDKKCLCVPEGMYQAEQSGDCDDHNPLANPGASEKCDNHIDDNCNGQTDEEDALGCKMYYYDSDNDGFGVTEKARCLCAQSGNYRTEVGGDCDDGDPSVHPGATEKCTAKDEDCDGQTDEEGAVGCIMYYFDADGDGYGIDGNSKCLCAPSGEYRAIVGGDCDDRDRFVHPGATEKCTECPEDGVCPLPKDENCDGQTDEEGASGCIVYYYDGDKDGYGVTGNTKCLCSPSDEYSTTKKGDCDDQNDKVNPGATEECNCIDDDCDGSVDEGLPPCACAPDT